jgi:hypothetical protein
MDAAPTHLVMTTDMLERLVSFDTAGGNASLSLLGLVPRPFGCGLSREQRSRRSKGQFACCDRPSRSWWTSARRPSRLTTVVKQITGSNSMNTVSYGTEGGPYQSAGIPTEICGRGHIARALKSDDRRAGSELKAHDYFVRRLAKRLLA